MTGESPKCVDEVLNIKTKEKKTRSWLMKTLVKIMATPLTRMRSHKCIFKDTEEAMSHNGK